MSSKKNSDGKVVMNYSGISYLCESGDHTNCGGICDCECHKKQEK